MALIHKAIIQDRFRDAFSGTRSPGRVLRGAFSDAFSDAFTQVTRSMRN
jgi:hypothetical protein